MSDVKSFLSTDELLEHWQGHRRLTRRVIDAFPEKQLFSYPVEGMRTFADLMLELVNVEESVAEGLSAGVWRWEPAVKSVSTKAELLEALGAQRAKMLEVYKALTPEKLAQVETDAWGMTALNLTRILYMIDNEIHHRAQGYVYLRLLGLEPPAFYER